MCLLIMGKLLGQDKLSTEQTQAARTAKQSSEERAKQAPPLPDVVRERGWLLRNLFLLLTHTHFIYSKPISQMLQLNSEKWEAV